MNILSRYKDIIPNREEFFSSVQQPLPTTFWINSIREEVSRVVAFMHELGVSCEKIPWMNDCFRTDPETKLGNTWLYRAGFIHVLEEVSMLPALLMECKPGDRVLDLCAAPGNKTVLLASHLAGKGSLIANEFNWGRLAILRGHLERLGIAGVSTFQHNGTNFNGQFGAFDRILCDVPCSCEGTHRKHAKEIAWGNPDFRERLCSTQKALLRKALQLCKVGGRIVYSTCTYAPEENEMVIDALLKEYPGIFRVIPVRVSDFEMDKGITDWNGASFDAQVALCNRVYPHRNNTGGFFIAVLEKIATLPAWSCVVEIPADRLIANPCETEDIQASVQQIQRHFGLNTDILNSFEYYHRNGDLFAVTKHPRIPTEPEFDSCGLMFLRKTINHPKMPTGFGNVIAPFATRMCIELSAEQRDAYMNRQKLQLPESQVAACPEDGYVVIRYEGIGIGQATLDRRSGVPVLHSLFPKSLL